MAEQKLKNERISRNVSLLQIATRGLLLCSLIIFCINLFIFKQKPLDYKEVENQMIQNEGKPLSFPGRVFDEYAYLDNNQLFGFPYAQEKKKKKTVQKKERIKNELKEDFCKSVRLVGIIVSEDSKVVIEDIKKNETVFLSVGDQMNGATLIDVQPGIVLFLYNGKEIQLVQ